MKTKRRDADETKLNLDGQKVGQTAKLTIPRNGAERVIESKVGVFELTYYSPVELPNPTPLNSCDCARNG